MNKPTFHKHGKDWFPHTPGDPMPCDGEAIIYALRNMNDMWGQPPRSVELAKRASWEEWDSRPNEIIGWRYADPQPESAESVTDELATAPEFFCPECHSATINEDSGWLCSVPPLQMSTPTPETEAFYALLYAPSVEGE